VAATLREAGLDVLKPALFLFEGIVVYLDPPVTESVLNQFREVTVPGSVLAISVSGTSAADRTSVRARFAEAVAAIGESARSFLEPAEATQLLARAGWQVDEPGPGRDRQRAIGLLTARASSASLPAGLPAERTVPAASPPPRPDGPAGVRPVPTAGRDLALPLHALLSRALVAFTIEADNVAERRLPHRAAARPARRPTRPG
jgi:hypothetical protein